MTIDELIPELLKHGDKYMVDSYEDVVVGYSPVRHSKRRRIQKKLNKRYGMKVVTKKKKCKKLDVTVDLILQFCQEQNLPIPDELKGVTT